LRDREGERSPSFDKWTSSDEKKISEQHERRGEESRALIQRQAGRERERG